MKIKEQSGLREVLDSVKLPRRYMVRQIFEKDGIKDPAGVLEQKLKESGLGSRIRPGMKVVLTGSSRQISNMPLVLRELADFVRAHGASPYIVPAMGSHGGATAQGQRRYWKAMGLRKNTAVVPSGPVWKRSVWGI